MDGTATINAKVDSLRLCGFVQNLACAKPRRRCKYWTRAGPVGAPSPSQASQGIPFLL